MIAVILLNAAAYFFYYFSGGSDFGARYWYFMIIPLVVLTIRGIQNLSTPADNRIKQPTESTRLLIGVLLLSMIALINFYPWRAIDKYHRYLQMRPDVRTIANQDQFAGGLVLIQGNAFPDFASAAAYNPIDFREGSVIFAWDGDRERRKLLAEAYPDRQVWVFAGPSLTGSGYHLVEGPFPAKLLVDQ